MNRAQLKAFFLVAPFAVGLTLLVLAFVDCGVFQGAASTAQKLFDQPWIGDALLGFSLLAVFASGFSIYCLFLRRSGANGYDSRPEPLSRGTGRKQSPERD